MEIVIVLFEWLVRKFADRLGYLYVDRVDLNVEAIVKQESVDVVCVNHYIVSFFVMIIGFIYLSVKCQSYSCIVLSGSQLSLIMHIPQPVIVVSLHISIDF